MAANWLDLRGMRERPAMLGDRFGTGKGAAIMAQIPFAKVRPKVKRQSIPLKVNLKVYEKNKRSAGTVRGWLECRMRRTDFDQLPCGRPHFDD
jgi:hypothetical protein